MNENKQYAVILPAKKRPGLIRCGALVPGKAYEFNAAEALRLVDHKGFEFVGAKDAKDAKAAAAAAEKSARAEVAEAIAKAEAEEKARAEADAKAAKAASDKAAAAAQTEG